MSLALHRTNAATIMRKASPTASTFSAAGTVYGRLTTTGAAEEDEGRNAVVTVETFRFLPGQDAFTERDQLVIGGRTFNVRNVRDAAGAGKEMVADLRGIK